MSSTNDNPLKDGGYKSRKLWLAFFAIGAVFAGALCSAKWQAFGAVYDTLVGGVVGIVAAYFTGNVANKFVVTRRAAPKKAIQPPMEEAPPEE
ncbi:MAG: hypothetical protein EBZ49_16560 [Proteobacteria bacterium]|nr:hypothetical protein [Pseudomonadota bacterium]